MKKLGFIVNPIAGMGGRVGLKGTDGKEILRKALELGAEPIAPARAVETLRGLKPLSYLIELVTYPDEMGEAEAKEAGFSPIVIGSITPGRTTAEDTRKAAKEMMEMKVDIIVFVGGDGTARDICSVVETNMPVLGVPAGVKVHSAVFAIDPEGAIRLLTSFIQTGLPLTRAEVMDIDEEAFRMGRVSAKLFGHMLVPFEVDLIQPTKISSPATREEKEHQLSIARYVVEKMEPDTIYILGPGTTVNTIAEILKVRKSLLGVDLVQNRRLLGFDVNERQILSRIRGERVKVIVTPIGGQGFIFGRGNQQISPAVLKAIGKENVIVVATPKKLQTLKKLRIDTGDPEVDKWFKGPLRVIVGYGKEQEMRVE